MTWTQIDGVAGLLVAAGTLSLSAFTYSLARKTQAMTSVAKEQVWSSNREAKATEALVLEAQTDRRLLWQPRLELRDLSELRTGWSATFRNTSAAPAIDVVVAIRRMHNVAQWSLFRLGDILPGESFAQEATFWRHGQVLSSVYEHFTNLGERHVVIVTMMCSDVLGRRFRFGVADPMSAYPGETSKTVGPEISSIDEGHPHHMGWADEPLIWG